VIKLWDIETGGEIFEYGEAHDGSAITCLTLDNTQRRFVCLHTYYSCARVLQCL